MAPGIHDIKVYFPAKDFDVSKKFYAALGFSASEAWGGTVDFQLDGKGFRLQNYYVRDWADNFMVVMDVDDVEAWHDHVRNVTNDAEFGSVRIKPPEDVDGARVLHVWDPSGILLVFVE